MASVQFHLDKKSGDQATCNVFAKVNVGSQAFKVFIGMRIAPDNWNAKPGVERRVRGSSAEALNQNERLRNLASDILKLYHQLKLANGNRNPEYEIFKQAARDRFSHNAQVEAPVVEAEKPITLVDLLDSCLDSQRMNISEGRAKHYQVVRKDLRAFAQSTVFKKERLSMEFTQLDIGFFDTLKRWYVEETGNINDTINGKLKMLRAVLNFHWKKGKVEIRNRINPDYERFDLLSVVEKQQDHMTMEEVMTLWRLDLSQRRALERTRDAYVFCSMVGPRHSDWCMLTKENIVTNTTIDGQVVRLLRYVQEKTGFICEAPLNDVAWSIIKKYWGQHHTLFPPLTDQKMNKNLHELLRLPELEGLFSTQIKLTSKKGSKKIVDTWFRHEALSFHSSRSNLASYLGEQGMSTREIQKIMGHLNERTTMKYVKLDQKTANRKALAILNQLNKKEDDGLMDMINEVAN